jgi:hypothetical protein
MINPPGGLISLPNISHFISSHNHTTCILSVYVIYLLISIRFSNFMKRHDKLTTTFL